MPDLLFCYYYHFLCESFISNFVSKQVISLFVCFGTTPGAVHGLHLALCSEITCAMAWRIIWYAGDQTNVSCVQGTIAMIPECQL